MRWAQIGKGLRWMYSPVIGDGSRLRVKRSSCARILASVRRDCNGRVPIRPELATRISYAARQSQFLEQQMLGLMAEYIQPSTQRL